MTTKPKPKERTIRAEKAEAALADAKREVEGWKNQAHDIAVSNASHVKWHREAEAALAEEVEAKYALVAEAENLKAALAEMRAERDCAMDGVSEMEAERDAALSQLQEAERLLDAIKATATSVLGALESDATRGQRRQAFNDLRDVLWPMPDAKPPAPQGETPSHIRFGNEMHTIACTQQPEPWACVCAPAPPALEPPSERHAFVGCDEPKDCGETCHFNVDHSVGGLVRYLRCGKPESDPVHAVDKEPLDYTVESPNSVPPQLADFAARDFKRINRDAPAVPAKEAEEIVIDAACNVAYAEGFNAGLHYAKREAPAEKQEEPPRREWLTDWIERGAPTAAPPASEDAEK